MSIAAAISHDSLIVRIDCVYLPTDSSTIHADMKAVEVVFMRYSSTNMKKSPSRQGCVHN